MNKPKEANKMENKYINIKPLTYTFINQIMKSNENLYCSVECYGENITEAVGEDEITKDIPTILEAIDAVDECHIYFWESEKDFEYRDCSGWVFWIGYNDGMERLSDYSINLEEKPIYIDKLITQWEDDHWNLIKSL